MAWCCSIMMTALSSMLAFGVMPLNIWLYSWRWTSQELQVPYVKILISLIIVTLPVIAGMVVRHCSRKWANYVSKVSLVCVTYPQSISITNLQISFVLLHEPSLEYIRFINMTKHTERRKCSGNEGTKLGD